MVRGEKVALAILGPLATAGSMGACAFVSGLSDYSEGDVIVDASTIVAQGAATTADAGGDRRWAGDAADDVDADDRVEGSSQHDATSRVDAAGGGVDALADGPFVRDSGADAHDGAMDALDAGVDAHDGGVDSQGGCGCATPGCCGGGCQVVHSNGVGQSFSDCTALGTFSQTQAAEACTAFTNNGVLCTLSSTYCSTITYAVCSGAASTCHCWQYSGPYPGTVQSSSLGCSAQCGASSDPQWN